MKKYILLFLIFVFILGGICFFVFLNSKDEEVVITSVEYAKRAEEYLDDRQYSKALEQFKFAINVDPTQTQYYLDASDIFLLKGKYDDAIAILTNGQEITSEKDR